jgi:hypothetical protein
MTGGAAHVGLHSAKLKLRDARCAVRATTRRKRERYGEEWDDRSYPKAWVMLLFVVVKWEVRTKHWESAVRLAWLAISRGQADAGKDEGGLRRRLSGRSTNN